MAKQTAKGAGRFGPLEAAVMEAVWAAGAPVSVREVMGRLNTGRAEPLAYTTVMTVMSRLAEKGALARSPARRGYAYEATASDQAGIAVQNVIRTYGEEAMAHFVEQARADPDLLRRMEQLLKEK